jgi:RNA polymerase sigma-70 factor (ECF subfamily)
MTETGPPSDEELVRRVRDGDDRAARVLFHRHRERLRARVRRRLPRALRGKVGASDVIQDAWLAAHVALGEFEDRGDGSFARWLNGILEHKAKDAARRHLGADMRDARREAPLPTSATQAGVTAGDPSPSAAAAGEERDAMLRAQIDRLPADHRTILRLVHDEGLTLAAAGERMGRSGDAARKLYGRALAGLTDLLAGRGIVA